MTLVGTPDDPHVVSAFGLILKRRSLCGSSIGGIAETLRAGIVYMVALTIAACHSLVPGTGSIEYH
jgi:D-arabinose 1-dehydrogenase-like Zn-dependent alcohol dehydrogenase